MNVSRHAGYIHDRHDPRDRYLASQRRALTVPGAVDWRPWATANFEETGTQACTAFAICRAAELVHQLFGAPISRRSELWLYSQERLIEGDPNVDAGAMLRTGLSEAKTIGIASQADWPFDPNNVLVQPPGGLAVAEGRIGPYYRCNNLADVKNALAHRWPVVAGITLYGGFEYGGVTGGVTPMPQTANGQVTEISLGRHSLYFLGYNDAQGWVIAGNCYGPGWGDNGFCYLPYGYFDPTLNLLWDLWAVTPR